jgi:hypothetical protein
MTLKDWTWRCSSPWACRGSPNLNLKMTFSLASPSVCDAQRVQALGVERVRRRDAGVGVRGHDHHGMTGPTLEKIDVAAVEARIVLSLIGIKMVRQVRLPVRSASAETEARLKGLDS